MSSHHIVREKQEPALILANGQLCDSKILNQLLEWSPFIIVLDSAFEKVVSLGIHFDVLLGDFDKINLTELDKVLPTNVQVVHTPNQDKPDLEKALDYLVEKGFEAVNILWATGKRCDHFMNNISLIGRFQHKLNIVLIDDYSKIYPINSGFTKYMQANENISLMPLNKVTHINTENLVWNLKDSTLEYPFSTSISNRVAEDGLVKIEFKSGILLVMECND